MSYNGSYGPEALLDSAGNAQVGATVTGPSGYTCTVNASGELTVVGPASDSVALTITPATGSPTSKTIRVLPLVSDLTVVQTNALAAAPMTPTAVKTANYTAAVGDLVPVDTTAGSVTITLPTAPADKSIIGVKHVIRGGTNTVTYTTGGTDVLNRAGGLTSFTLTLAGQGAQLQYKAAGGIWYVIGDDIPLGQLDLRYAPVTLPDATSTAKGVVQLAGDLGGTAASPTVPGLATKAASDLSNVTPATGRSALGLGTAATAAKTSAGSAGVLDAQDASTINARTPTGAAGGDLVGTFPSPTLATTGVTAGTYPAATVTVDAKGRVTTIAAGSAATDATTTAKGVVQLAGDLGGTAAAPTVPAALKGDTTGITDGQLVVWSAAQSKFLPANPTGVEELVYSPNTSGTPTSIANAQTVDIPNCVLTVQPNARPVWLQASVTFKQTATGRALATLALIETTGGGSNNLGNIAACPLPNPQTIDNDQFFQLAFFFRLGSVASARSFKIAGTLQALAVAPGSPTVQALNTVANPSFLTSLAR